MGGIIESFVSLFRAEVCYADLGCLGNKAV